MARLARPQPWAWLWAAQIQFFIAYEVTLSAWTTPFDWRRITISEAEATYCQAVGVDKHLTCSPWHLLMQVSFFITGLLMAAGALALPRKLVGRAAVARTFLVLGGAGLVVVSLTPRLEDSAKHMAGAIPTMVLGNLGLLLVGLAARSRYRWAGLAAAVMGAVGFVAFTVLAVGQVVWATNTVWLTYGFSSIERVVVYPMIVGMIVLGLGALLAARQGQRGVDGQPPAEQEQSRDDAGDDEEAGRHAVTGDQA